MGLAGVNRAFKWRNPTAWALLAVILFIVIAPSVDLAPTVLRGVHHVEIGRSTVVAATLASMVFVHHTIQALRSWESRDADISVNDLVVLDCTRRC